MGQSCGPSMVPRMGRPGRERQGCIWTEWDTMPHAWTPRPIMRTGGDGASRCADAGSICQDCGGGTGGMRRGQVCCGVGRHRRSRISPRPPPHLRQLIRPIRLHPAPRLRRAKPVHAGVHSGQCVRHDQLVDIHTDTFLPCPHASLGLPQPEGRRSEQNGPERER